LDNGTCRLNPIRENEPAAIYRQPQGTKSVMYEIVDQSGARIATAHAYVLPDGSLGASGKYDPKSIISGPDLLIPGV
jgi:hypothetical protein